MLVGQLLYQKRLSNQFLFRLFKFLNDFCLEMACSDPFLFTGRKELLQCSAKLFTPDYENVVNDASR